LIFSFISDLLLALEMLNSNAPDNQCPWRLRSSHHSPG
jgi:hypothetical protein